MPAQQYKPAALGLRSEPFDWTCGLAVNKNLTAISMNLSLEPHKLHVLERDIVYIIYAGLLTV